MSRISIKIEDEHCCGSKMCSNIAPQAFLVGDTGYASTREGAENCSLDVLKKAARSCPTQCIILYLDDVEIDLF